MFVFCSGEKKYTRTLETSFQPTHLPPILFLNGKLLNDKTSIKSTNFLFKLSRSHFTINGLKSWFCVGRRPTAIGFSFDVNKNKLRKDVISVLELRFNKKEVV